MTLPRGRLAGLLLAGVLLPSCATTRYALRPESDRSAQVAAGRSRPGMTLADVVTVMVESRLLGQRASLTSAASCADSSLKISLPAGEPAGDYASVEVFRGADTSVAAQGFARQGSFLEAVRLHQKELLACPAVVLTFDAKLEGGCGESTLPLNFDSQGRVSRVGPVEASRCGS